MACCRWRHDQSPFGGEAVGPNPTDRAKGGTKRSILVDGNGIPVSVVVDGANRHDKKLLEATIEQLQAPQPDDEEIHLCLDKVCLAALWSYFGPRLCRIVIAA